MHRVLAAAGEAALGADVIIIGLGLVAHRSQAPAVLPHVGGLGGDDGAEELGRLEMPHFLGLLGESQVAAMMRLRFCSIIDH
jgi:hypothetical protein